MCSRLDVHVEKSFLVLTREWKILHGSDSLRIVVRMVVIFEIRNDLLPFLLDLLLFLVE